MSSKAYDLIIVGAGLAGAIAAWNLQDHSNILILERDGDEAKGSGISAGLINPLMAQKGRKVYEAENGLKAFHELLVSAAVPKEIARMDGLLRPAKNEQQATWFQDAANTSSHLGTWLCESEIKKQFPTVNAPFGGLWVFSGGTVKIRALANWLVQHANITYHKATVRGIIENKGFTTVIDEKGEKYTAPKCICCMGYGFKTLPLFKNLNLHPIKGQVEVINTPPDTQTPSLSGGMYVSTFENQWVAGSSFVHHFETLNSSPTEKEAIIGGIKEMLTLPFQDFQTNSEVGVRITVPKTRLPMIGPVSERGDIWVFTGFGAKGLLLAPYLAQNIKVWMQNPQLIPSVFLPH